MSQFNRFPKPKKARGRSVAVAIAATLLAISGCGKSHKDDPFQGTWFYDRSTSKTPGDWSSIRAIEFKDRKDKSGSIVITRYSPSDEITGPNDQITASYTISAPNQMTISMPGVSEQGVLDVVVQDDDTVMCTTKDHFSSTWQMRWLKSGETLASAEKADHDKVQKVRDEEDAKRKAQSDAAMARAKAERAEALKKRQHQIDVYTDMLKKPGLVLALGMSQNGKEQGFALDLKPGAVASYQAGYEAELKLTSFAGTAWVANDAGVGTGEVTLTPVSGNDGTFQLLFTPKSGQATGAYQSRLQLQVHPAPTQQVPANASPDLKAALQSLDVPDLEAEMYINGSPILYLVESNPAKHDQLISQFKTGLERVTREQSIAWWFEYNGGRSRLSADQRQKVIAVNKQLEEKYGPENLLTPQQRQDRANESADLIAAVFTPSQLADTPDCRAMQNYWDQAGYINGMLPADNDALINQMLQRTRDITIFLTPAHKSTVPAGSDQWLIGQRRDWVKQNADFEYVASPAIAAAAQKSRSKFILLAERAKASATGDCALLYSDGTVAALSEADAQAALDAQANQMEK